MSVKPMVIFLFPYTPVAWDAERFGFAVLRRKGIKFLVLDLSKLLGAKAEKSHDDAIITVQSYAMLTSYIQANAAQCVFIDNLNGMTGFQWRSRHIFKLLKKYQATYYVVEIGALPTISTRQVLWQDQLKKVLNLKRVWLYLSYKIKQAAANIEANRLKAYQMPHKVFTTYSQLVEPYLKKYRLAKSSVVGIHSFDYDRYLAYLKGPKPTMHSRPYCVFIDQGLAYHRDFIGTAQGAPVTAAAYFKDLNQFFTRIERETGLDVIIAGNPRIDYAVLPDMFFGRPVITGETLALIAQSELVLMHSSTAVSFAVIFDKPIMILKTTEIAQAPGLGTMVDNMAHALGLQPVAIDQADILDQLHLSNYDQWPRDYTHYKYQYIMSRGVDDQPTWEIVIHELEKDLAYGTT